MIKKIKICLIMLSGLFAISISSCTTTPVCMTASNTPLNYKTITANLGKVTGESKSAVSVLGLWMVGSPDIQAAIDDALSKKKADALINVKCYETCDYYFFVSITKVRVEGEAVKFYKTGESDDSSR